MTLRDVALPVALVVMLVLVAGVVTVTMPGVSRRGELAPLTPAQEGWVVRLRQHVTVLAGRIGDRNVTAHPRSLALAARYIAWQWQEMGFGVAEQEFTSMGRQVRNLEVTLPGTGDGHLIVGAHYDTPHGTPGADDNASGVAVLLELGRALRGRPLGCTVHLVAFVNEEHPFFKTGEMGSRVHAQRARREGWRVAGMFSLESLGYYDTRAGSQGYPQPLSLFYPDTGDFLAFVADSGSRDLLFAAITAFRRQGVLPSEGLAAPAWIPGVDWSDHVSYWEEGYPAVMVTDTAIYRNPHYHSERDLPETVDHGRLARVGEGLAAVVAELAGPLNGSVPGSGWCPA